MRLRDDIDPANTWVVSDTHFGHDNIVGFCHRPEDHEQVMIAEWRAHVPDDATIIHLGDLCYKGNARFKHITAKELTGDRKVLVMGNHDRQRMSFYRDCGFRIWRPFKIMFNGREVSFSHYAWNDEEDAGPMPPWAWRIHGHIHNNGYSRGPYTPFLKNHINISVEQTKYRPVNLKVLLDAAILGIYEETTDEQLAEARARKEENLAAL